MGLVQEEGRKKHMFIAEALVPIWVEPMEGTGQTKANSRPVLIIVETLGASLRGQLLNLTESRAKVVPNDPFLMSSNVRVSLRFRSNDVVYTLSGLTQASEIDDSFNLVFDAVTRQKIIVFVGGPPASEVPPQAPAPNRKPTKAEQRIVRRERPPDGIERRVQHRHVLEAEATLVIVEKGTILKCHVLEISLSGCRLFTDRPLNLQEDTLVEVEFLGRGYPFRLAARTRVKIEEHLVGLEFMNGSPRTLERLRELISELEMEYARSMLTG